MNDPSNPSDPREALKEIKRVADVDEYDLFEVDPEDLLSKIWLIADGALESDA